MKITYFGHSTFLVESEGFRGIIDPFLTGNPHTNKTPEDLKEISHIFVTHGHGDHLGDTVEIAKKWDSLVITNFEISTYLSEQGVRTHAMHIGGRRNFDFGRVKMTPALHGSGIPTDQGLIEGGLAGGFIIELEGKKIYHAGDTGLSMEMNLLKREDIHVALLPIGGNFTMDIEDALLAVEMIQPRMVIPMHYKTFPIIPADPEDFAKQVRGAEVRVVAPGESFEV